MLVSFLLPLTVCCSSQVLACFFSFFSEPENCLKAAQNRQESGVASRLPWPVVFSIGAAARRGARLHPRAKDESAAKGGCRLAGFRRLAGYRGSVTELYQRDKSILVLPRAVCDFVGSQAVDKQFSAQDKISW